MIGSGDDDQNPSGPWPDGPIIFTWLACAWIAGLIVAGWTAGVFGFRTAGVWPAWLLFAAAVSCAAAAIFLALRRRERASRLWLVVAFFFVAAVWWSVFIDRQRDDDVGQWAGSAPQLAEVVGHVLGPTRMSSVDEGAFQKFSFTSPSTTTQLEVEAIRVNGVMRPASGRLLLRVGEADFKIHDGLRIRAQGWLAAIDGPMNPGEFDYRKIMLDRGVKGRLSVPKRANWREEPEEPLTPGNIAAMERRAVATVTSLSHAASNATSGSLRLGMPSSPQELALLDALLLGRWDRQIGDLNQAFRRAGLTHLLAISGANLTILLAIVWAVARAVTGSPRGAMLIIGAVLAGYLFMLPPQVPILRAGIMAGVFCAAMFAGRQTRAIDSLALAALIVLIWRPEDLYDPGLQLSFGGVAALLLLTKPVANWLAPSLMIRQRGGGTWFQRAARWTVEYVAASIAVWAVTLPLLAFHFNVITPMGGVWTMLLSPVFSVLMGIAYFKMMLGLWLPNTSMLMALPVHLLTAFITWAVEAAATWRWSMIELACPPTWIWAVATGGTLWAVCIGWFKGAEQSMRSASIRAVLALTLCAVWLIAPQIVGADSQWAAHGSHGVIAPPHDANAISAQSQKPALRINALAVGDGSCFVLRIPTGDSRNPEHVLMFDCGSQQYLSVGERSVVPALLRLGVTRIDTAMISHADLDHYGGLLDTMDLIPISRVLTTHQVLDNASANPASAIAHLIDGIKNRGTPITAIERGWHERIGDTELNVLWPSADFRPPKTNDTSIVLAASTAGRRTLLTGDIQKAAIQAMLKSGVDVRADIAELSHHGAFVDASPAWVRAVNPLVVLQSCGHRRERDDKWTDWFVETAGPRVASGRLPRLPGTQRLMTARVGLIEVMVEPDGRITWRSMRAGRPVISEP